MNHVSAYVTLLIIILAVTIGNMVTTNLLIIQSQSISKQNQDILYDRNVLFNEMINQSKTINDKLDILLSK